MYIKRQPYCIFPMVLLHYNRHYFPELCWNSRQSALSTTTRHESIHSSIVSSSSWSCRSPKSKILLSFRSESPFCLQQRKLRVEGSHAGGTNRTECVAWQRDILNTKCRRDNNKIFTFVHIHVEKKFIFFLFELLLDCVGELVTRRQQYLLPWALQHTKYCRSGYPPGSHNAYTMLFCIIKYRKQKLLLLHSYYPTNIALRLHKIL